jgi:hypothetical protein
VRPASLSEVREVLVWGPERNIPKEIEDGILLRAVAPQAKFREGAWGKSTNFVQPILKPLSTFRLLHATLNRQTPEFDTKLGNSGADATPMTYVDSSQFRRTGSKVESPRLQTVPETKSFSRNSPALAAGKTQHKASKVEKLKKVELDQVLTTEDSLLIGGVERVKAPPPVWSHALLSDELSDPFSRLPSNEEYDRSSRYTHSILYGFNTEF